MQLCARREVIIKGSERTKEALRVLAPRCRLRVPPALQATSLRQHPIQQIAHVREDLACRARLVAGLKTAEILWRPPEYLRRPIRKRGNCMSERKRVTFFFRHRYTSDYVCRSVHPASHALIARIGFISALRCARKHIRQSRAGILGENCA